MKYDGSCFLMTQSSYTICLPSSTKASFTAGSWIANHRFVFPKETKWAICNWLNGYSFWHSSSPKQSMTISQELCESNDLLSPMFGADPILFLYGRRISESLKKKKFRAFSWHRCHYELKLREIDALSFAHFLTHAFIHSPHLARSVSALIRSLTYLLTTFG